MLLGQIFLLALALIFFIFTLRRRTYRWYTFAWSLVWMGVAIVALWPELLSRFADALGIGRGVDVALYVAILALFFAVFKIMLRIYILEDHIAILNQHIALLSAKQKE